eukprot:4932229-Pleurochrysis_carterae.AAC.3
MRVRSEQARSSWSSPDCSAQTPPFQVRSISNNRCICLPFKHLRSATAAPQSRSHARHSSAQSLGIASLTSERIHARTSMLMRFVLIQDHRARVWACGRSGGMREALTRQALVAAEGCVDCIRFAAVSAWLVPCVPDTATS